MTDRARSLLEWVKAELNGLPRLAKSTCTCGKMALRFHECDDCLFHDCGGQCFCQCSQVAEDPAYHAEECPMAVEQEWIYERLKRLHELKKDLEECYAQEALAS